MKIPLRINPSGFWSAVLTDNELGLIGVCNSKKFEYVWFFAQRASVRLTRPVYLYSPSGTLHGRCVHGEYREYFRKARHAKAKTA